MMWLPGYAESALRDARGARILAYHGVCRRRPLRYNTLFITRDAFERQLQLFTRYCSIISLDDHFHRRFDPGRFNISLSFDDGFANNHSYVLPLLDKYRVPATFFVTGIREAGYDVLWNDALTIGSRHGKRKLQWNGTAYRKKWGRAYVAVDSKRLLMDMLRDTGFVQKRNWMELTGRSFLRQHNSEYWLQLSTAQLRDMAQSPWVTIGSHGYYHNDLGRIPASDIGEELRRSKNFLEQVTGKPVTQLAFPYGSYRSETVTAAREAGYKQLYATEFLFPSDTHEPDLRERMGINPFLSPRSQLRCALKGSYA